LQSNRPLVCAWALPCSSGSPTLACSRDPKVNDWPEIEKSERFTAVRKALGAKGMFASYAYTGAGEASAAFLLSELLSTRKRNVLFDAQQYRVLEQIVDDDVVFVGPPKFNPQLQAAALAQDIVIEPEGIRNNKPQPGEPVFLQDLLYPKSHPRARPTR